MKTVHDMVEEAKGHIQEVNVDEAKQAIADADYLIDVREEDEFHAGHIEGAINIPRGVLEFKLSSEEALADRMQKVVLYCKSSGRSALAAEAMKEMGYQQVVSLAGGIEAWKAADQAVVTPSLPDFE